MPLSEARNRGRMKQKCVNELALDNLDVAIVNLKGEGCDPAYCGMVYVQPILHGAFIENDRAVKALADGVKRIVQPEIGQEWIEDGEYRRVNAEGQIEDGWGVVPNCPDGRDKGG